MSDSPGRGRPGEPPRPPRDDQQLLAVLAAALDQLDPVPPAVVAAGQDAFTWRTIDEELAELAALAFDSAQEPVGSGVRGPATERSLSFEFADVVIDLEVSGTGEAREVAGQVVPSEVDSIELHHPSGARLRTVADALGRFRLARVASGPIRILCRFTPSSHRPMLLTEWIVI